MLVKTERCITHYNYLRRKKWRKIQKPHSGPENDIVVKIKERDAGLFIDLKKP